MKPTTVKRRGQVEWWGAQGMGKSRRMESQRVGFLKVLFIWPGRLGLENEEDGQILIEREKERSSGKASWIQGKRHTVRCCVEFTVL